MNFILILGLILSVSLVAVLAIAVRVFLVKDGEARGGCAGKNPMLRAEGAACTMCGAMPSEECKKED